MLKKSVFYLCLIGIAFNMGIALGEVFTPETNQPIAETSPTHQPATFGEWYNLNGINSDWAEYVEFQPVKNAFQSLVDAFKEVY